MSKSSISINYTTTAGKKGQKSITDINPAASNGVIKEFAHKLNALTTNNYVGTNRVDKIPLPDSSALKTPFVHVWAVGGSDAVVFNFSDEITQPVNFTDVTQTGPGLVLICMDYQTDGVPFIKSVPEGATAEFNYYYNEMSLPPDKGAEPDWYVADDGNELWIQIFMPVNNDTCCGDFVIGFTETEKYAAAEVTISIAADEGV